MDLQEKIAQMLLLGFEGQHLEADSLIAKDLCQYPLGGVILFNYHCKERRLEKNIENPIQVKTLTERLQQWAASRAEHPLFIAIDYEGGRVNRLDETQGFPETKSAKAIGEMSDEEILSEAQKMAGTLSSLGFNFNFSPVVDIDTNPNNQVISHLERAFCSKPNRVNDIAKHFRHSFADKGILSTYKHFPGHGSSEDDSHIGAVDITHSWREEELFPYQQLSQAHNPLDAVMIGHLIHKQFDASGKPATLSKAIITDLLRNQLGFRGLVVSDDMQMDAISKHYSEQEALIHAVNAGVDLLIYGNQLIEEPLSASYLIDCVSDAVKQGKISPERIDESYQRIVNVKKQLNQSGS